MSLVTIYAITHIASGNAYIGSTIQVRERFARHRYELRKGRHHCRHLQNAWSKYGPDAFSFSVVAEQPATTERERKDLEIAWISRIGTYNAMVADAKFGCFSMSDETKRRFSEAMKKKLRDDADFHAIFQRCGEKVGALAKTPESRAAMSQHSKRRWKDGVEREKLSAGLKSWWANPENVRKHAGVTSRRVSTKSERSRQSKALKAAWADPEKRQKLQARLDARWADPAAKDKQRAALRAAWARRKAAALVNTSTTPVSPVKTVD